MKSEPKVKKYRRNPDIVEAIVVTPGNAVEVCDWISGAYEGPGMIFSIHSATGVSFRTASERCATTVRFGDLVVRGSDGHFYSESYSRFQKMHTVLYVI